MKSISNKGSRAVRWAFLGGWIQAVLLGGTALGQSNALLFDFGSNEAQTALPPIRWNNITETIAQDPNGFSFDLVSTTGGATELQFFMVAPFNGVNANGTQASTVFPASASRDSLFGNTEAFGAGADFFPEFVLANLNPDRTYDLTFYASRDGVNDVREARYSVEGATSGEADLNASNNVDEVVTVSGIIPDQFGEIYVRIRPGPNNNNGNHFTYLGAMRVDERSESSTTTLLFDFGGANTTTEIEGGGTPLFWNNVNADVAANDLGTLPNLVTTSGSATDLGISMVSRWNGVNQNGTADSSDFPETATRDSFFGNTEEFGGLSDITPIFIVNGLNSQSSYDLTFFGSRMGVGDNRETRYTVEGSESAFVDLNVANNVSEVATLSGVKPDANGEVRISVTPGPNNNNANHFVYLGVMQIVEPSVEGNIWLMDWGGADINTDLDVIRPDESWNNVPVSIGTVVGGQVQGILTTEGGVTGISLEILARFNGANLNGVTTSTVFPESASSDSLFGNTEAFGGLENVFPEFKLSGLFANTPYSFTFYGSRSGVSDVRETRFTVSGNNEKTGDLNMSNNVDEVVVVEGVVPDANGEIRIRLTPGPNNNNGSHFTYLGAMKVEWSPAFMPRILVDLGAATSMTDFGVGDPFFHWNNLSIDVGGNDTGSASNFVSVDGSSTTVGWQMVSRFNGVNESGTTEFAGFPGSATRDSMFGNTELFNNLENIFPVFKLTGLDVNTVYDLTFYASRMGVSDNRETHYAVTGANSGEADLDVGNNVDQSVQVTGIKPTPDGEITVALTPGVNNSNGNHFTYLGVLVLDWEVVEETVVTLGNPSVADGKFSFDLTGAAGETYQIQSTSQFTGWTLMREVTLTSETQRVEVDVAGDALFIRAVK